MFVGLKTRQDVSLRDIRDSIPGFVELLSINKFNRLVTLQYHSLIQFYTFPSVGSVEKRNYYGLLFGPLALVNSNTNIRDSFYHAGIYGDLLLWRAFTSTVYVSLSNVLSAITTYKQLSMFCQLLFS